MEKKSSFVKFYQLTESENTFIPDDFCFCGVDPDGKFSLLLSDGNGNSVNSLDVDVSATDADSRGLLDAINGELPLNSPMTNNPEEAFEFTRSRYEQFGSETQAFDSSMSDIIHKSSGSSPADSSGDSSNNSKTE